MSELLNAAYITASMVPQWQRRLAEQRRPVFAAMALVGSLVIAGDAAPIMAEHVRLVDSGPRIVNLAQLMAESTELLHQPIEIKGGSFRIQKRAMKFLPPQHLQGGDLYPTVTQTVGLLTDTQHNQLTVELDGDIQNGNPNTYTGLVSMTGSMVRQDEAVGRDDTTGYIFAATTIVATPSS